MHFEGNRRPLAPQAGLVHTGFIDEHREQLLPGSKADDAEAAVVGAIALCLLEAPSDSSPFAVAFRVNSALTREVRFEAGQRVAVTYGPGGLFSASCGSVRLRARAQLFVQPAASAAASPRVLLELLEEPSGALRRFAVIPPCEDAPRDLVLLPPSGDRLQLRCAPPSFEAKMAAGSAAAAAGAAVAPMPGLVEKLLVKAGDRVQPGQALVTMIAMKMEYTIRAGRAGRVTELRCEEGASVKKGELLVAVETEEELD